MTKDEAIERWKTSGEKNLTISRDMMRLKHYDWALFMGQLALEKFLKGLIIKNIAEVPPPIHDLLKLAKLAQLSVDEAKVKNMNQITRFHIQARYDDIKYELYKQATPAFTKTYMKIIEEYALWLTKRY